MPSAVLEDLRACFGDEIALSRLALEQLTDLDAARRVAHTFASSAWVVGETEIARVARAVETHLPGGPVAELLELLNGYQP